ncbi:MAG: hypothetical protein ABEJ07_06755 [Candidatus Nanohaloarchaea archaeon]
MSPRKILLAALVLMVPAVSGAPSFSVKQSCDSGEEPLFSMYSRSGGNVAKPGYYKWQVCGEEVENSAIRTSCKEDERRVISMKTKTDSHASVYDTYHWKVCATDVNPSVAQSCSENPIVSLYSKDDSHAAEPGYFKWQVCPQTRKPPENVTLQMKMDASNVYVSGDPAQEKTYNPLELDYPYIASDQTTGIVSYGSLVSLEYEQKSRDVFRVTQDSGSFLIPNTGGGYQEIEDDQEQVVNRRFLNLLEPSFHYTIPEKPVVKVYMDMEDPVKGFTGTETGSIEIAVRNTLDNETLVEFRTG